MYSLAVRVLDLIPLPSSTPAYDHLFTSYEAPPTPITLAPNDPCCIAPSSSSPTMPQSSVAMQRRRSQQLSIAMVGQAATGGCECARRRASVTKSLTLTHAFAALAAQLPQKSTSSSSAQGTRPPRLDSIVTAGRATAPCTRFTTSSQRHVQRQPDQPCATHPRARPPEGQQQQLLAAPGPLIFIRCG